VEFVEAICSVLLSLAFLEAINGPMIAVLYQAWWPPFNESSPLVQRGRDGMWANNLTMTNPRHSSADTPFVYKWS